MKKKLVGVLFSLFTLSACSGGLDNPSSSVSTGEEIFKKNCSVCHSEDLNTIGSKLSKEQIVAAINKGSSAMPAGLISGEELEKVSSWLATKK